VSTIFGLELPPASAIPAQRTTIVSPAADATGVIDATLGPVPGGQQWRIERIIVSSTSSAPTTAAVYADDAQPGNYLDPGTTAANLDVAEYTFPPILRTGELLRIRWEGASVGAVGTAVVQYHLEQV
jgi:hypothetical protein